MKHISLIVIALLISITLYAQPQAFSYQAIVSDAQNSLVANRQIGVQISILKDSPEAAPLYAETHSATTNANGLFTIEIGRGASSSATSFDSIAWNDGTYYLKSEIAPDGGNNYTIISTTALLSVPYALHANTASTVVGLADSLRNLRAQSEMAILSMLRYYDSIVATLTAATDTSHHDDTTTDTNESPSVPVFSVSDGHSVLFSPANLQYQATTATWRFATHQYDVVGDNNSHISSTYDGWIDLFGWGTSGWPSNANVYKPFATSADYADYYVGGAAANDLAGNYAKADWGVFNAISNGGNSAGLWRTPTSTEWNYLIAERQASTINNVENARFVRATVGGVQGMVLFPDHFAYPIGIDEPADSLINNMEASPFSTTYTIHEWAAIETDGAVFLPVGGYREGTRLVTNPPTGYYWSSSHQTPQWALALMFNANTIAPQNSTPRWRGCYVRLVQDITAE